MRMLIGADGSPGAATAISFLLSLPLSARDHVTVLTVPLYRFVRSEDGEAAIGLPSDEVLRRAALSVAAAARARFAARGIGTATVVREGPVAEALELASLELGVDLVVVGSRGLGTIGGILLGSTGRALARRPRVSILVVRDSWAPPRRVLAAIDGTVASEAAIDLLARLPLPDSAEVTLLWVLPAAAKNDRDGADDADTAMARATKALRSRHRIARSIVERGDAAERIVLRSVAGAADLVVIGSREPFRTAGILRTSVASDVLARAQCAVLVAKPPLVAPAVYAESHPATELTSARS
jgi:nucleotide-binding universal stress UspA family protein